MVFSFLNKKAKSKNFYLGLLLKEEEGIIMILAVTDNKIKILEKEKFFYSNGWENLTEDVDELLFRIEKKLNIKVNETIFFIYSHLLNEKGTEIKRPYLDKIKELVENLELSPLGYIECYEAASLYLAEKEDMPLTAILVEIDATQLGIFIYKGGKLSFKKTLSRTDNLVIDLNTAFAQLKGSYLLPARIILYDSSDLDEASSKILTYRWSEEYFIQLPKVDILREDEIIDALVTIFEKQKLAQSSFIVKKEEKGERLGFVVGGDVDIKDKNKGEPALGIFLINKIKQLVSKINFSINFKYYQKVLLFIGIIFIILGLAINEFFFHKARLTIFVPYITVNKQMVINLPYKVKTVSKEFFESKPTTGKKEIGEKARGEVIVYNTNFNKEKFFKKGTEIEFNGLKFIFEEDIKVASASTATTPGTAKVKVVAEAIGPQYNLSKGKRFSIDDTSYAENINDFSGGTKKEIQTISKSDLELLKSSIIEKAKKIKISDDISSYEIIIPELSSVNLEKLIFSGEVAEAASSVSLKAQVEIVFYYYQKDQLIKAISDEIKKQIPAGFILKDDSIVYKSNSVAKNDSLVALNLQVKAKAVKEISSSLVLKRVVGRHKNKLNYILKKEFQLQGYDIKIKNSLPIIDNFLPFFQKNIDLVISTL